MRFPIDGEWVGASDGAVDGIRNPATGELWSHKAAAALAAGNAIITKPPEECPLTVLRIAEIMEAPGLPRAAHQVVTDTLRLGDPLSENTDIGTVVVNHSTAMRVESFPSAGRSSAAKRAKACTRPCSI